MTKDEIINTAEERFRKLYNESVDKIDEGLISTYMNGLSEYSHAINNYRLRKAVFEYYQEMFSIETRNDVIIFTL